MRRIIAPYLIGNHPKCVDIALFRRDPLSKTKIGRIQQFRCQVLEVIIVVKFALHVIELRGESIVSETGMAITVDKNVFLCKPLVVDGRIVCCVY